MHSNSVHGVRSWEVRCAGPLSMSAVVVTLLRFSGESTFLAVAALCVGKACTLAMQLHLNSMAALEAQLL